MVSLIFGQGNNESQHKPTVLKMTMSTTGKDYYKDVVTVLTLHLKGLVMDRYLQTRVEEIGWTALGLRVIVRGNS